MTSDRAISPAPPNSAPAAEALAAPHTEPAPSLTGEAAPVAPKPPAAQRPLLPKDIYFPYWPRDGEPYITKSSHPEYFEDPDLDADFDPNDPAAPAASSGADDDPTPITPASFNRALEITDLIERILERDLKFHPGRPVSELEVASRIVMRTIAIRKTILRITKNLTKVDSLDSRNRNRNRTEFSAPDFDTAAPAPADTAPGPSSAPGANTTATDPDSSTIPPLFVPEVRTVPQVPPSRDIRRDLLGADPEHAVARALDASPDSEPLPRAPRAQHSRASRAVHHPASPSADLSPQARALPRPIHLYAADKLPFTFEELADATPSELEEARDDYERNMIYALEVAMDEEVFYEGFCDDYLAAFPFDTT